MGGLLCKTKEGATGADVPNSHEANKETAAPSGVDGTADHLDFPFIADRETREHLKRSKIMFILRSLPGRGKSTIASELKRLYDEAAVCSADEHSFRGSEDELDATRLEFAHQLCKEKAEAACQEGANVIIVDNANIYRWQVKDFASLARKSEYGVIVVEPRNAEMVTENYVDGVSGDVPVPNIETFTPLYYGWFLNEAGSGMLHLIGQAYLEECLKVPAFEEDFKNHCSAAGSKDIFDYYKGCRSLHCTAKFCGKNYDDAVSYSNKPEVRNGYGRCYEMCVVGLVMTPRTYGARVKLDEDQLKLWAGDAQESSPACNVGTDRRQGGHGEKRDGTTFTCEVPLVCVPQTDVSFQPTKGPGSRAHVTLGCADCVPPVTAGLDLLEVVDYESRADSSVPVETFETSRGALRRYGTSSWVLYLNQKIYVKTLFTGFY